MADEAETPDTDELLLTEEVEPEAPETDEQPQTEEPDDEEEVFAFGDEPTEPQDGDSGLVKHLREELKRARKEAADAKKATPQEQAIEVGEKPTLAGCDYDEDRFEVELDAWKERDRQAKEATTAKARAAQEQEQAWENELKAVAEEKTALAKDDADDAFETVRATLGDQMNALVIHAVDKGNRARLIYALAKNPSRLEALANINGAADPIRFIKEVAKLEGQLKMVKRRKAPDPDTPERPSAAVSNTTAGVQKQLAKLKAKAQDSGDYTEYLAYKRKIGG